MVGESSFWWEVARTLPGLLTALTAIVGVTIAARGLTKWRVETIGKRQAELAEEILADFYEARDAIEQIRFPTMQYPVSRPRKDDETEADSGMLDMYWSIGERLNAKSELFAKVSSRRYRLIAHFGAQAGEPFKELERIRHEMSFAIPKLLEEGGMKRNQRMSIDDEIQLNKLVWAQANDDIIEERLDRMINAIEQLCRPIIAADTVQGKAAARNRREPSRRKRGPGF
jgi:hypothetical protein